MFLAVFGTCFDAITKDGIDDAGCCGAVGGCCVVMLPVAGNLQYWFIINKSQPKKESCPRTYDF
jgi:hypothetical protein